MAKKLCILEETPKNMNNITIKSGYIQAWTMEIQNADSYTINVTRKMWNTGEKSLQVSFRRDFSGDSDKYVCIPTSLDFACCFFYINIINFIC